MIEAVCHILIGGKSEACRPPGRLSDARGAERGGHAHRGTDELLISMSGSFDVLLHDGTIEQRFQLNRSHYGLYVPAMTWRSLENFSSGSVCLVLASQGYDEADYYRDRDYLMMSRVYQSLYMTYGLSYSI